ncbi:hypothetical protein CK203_088850 [Vitis vinifera]|uniref:U1-type domain-containing protein n=1 Tax=Vitis vinifera TaxID=29760 RepID=A0A438D4H6_VITVI|nr:hypothetical protein CK203_088850 [Vitis vinifera]
MLQNVNSNLLHPSLGCGFPTHLSWVIREGVKDVIVWQLSKGGTFLVKSFYSSLAGCSSQGFPTSISLAIPPNGTEQLITANVNSILWTTSTVQARSSGTRKKGAKKMKIIQSAYCEVCKVDCNSDDILAQHKLGRRHKKNMEKLKDTVAPVPTVEASSDNPVIGPPENPNKGKAVSGKKTKATAESLEDLETKRRRIVECGAAADAVRTCSICNVVCNSETVFNYHLAGQKHAAMVKKHAAGRGVATAT